MSSGMLHFDMLTLQNESFDTSSVDLSESQGVFLKVTTGRASRIRGLGLNNNNNNNNYNRDED